MLGCLADLLEEPKALGDDGDDGADGADGDGDDGVTGGQYRRESHLALEGRLHNECYRNNGLCGEDGGLWLTSTMLHTVGGEQLAHTWLCVRMCERARDTNH